MKNKEKIRLEILLDKAHLHSRYATIISVGASLLLQVLSVILTATSTQWLFGKIIFLWTLAPSLFATPTSQLVCGISVLGLGRLFYWLREHYLTVYAILEMGVAAGTSYLAAAKLYITHDNNTALLALLGSIYISVRAWDNYTKGKAKR